MPVKHIVHRHHRSHDRQPGRLSRSWPAPSLAATPRSSEGRLGPLPNQQPTATIPPNPPPTSAVRGWPHWYCSRRLRSLMLASSIVGLAGSVLVLSSPS